MSLVKEITFAHVLVALIVLIGAAGWLAGKIEWDQYLAGIGIAVGLGSGHGLSPDTLIRRGN